MLDADGRKISEWGKPHTKNTEMFCCVCEIAIDIAKGFYALHRHSESERHKSNFNLKKCPNQLNLIPGCSSQPALKLYSTKDSAYTAELIWCMKLVSGNIPISMCQGIDKVFHSMFPGALPEHFSINPTKASYLITDALAPYFREKFLKELCNIYFTLMFDETTNSGGYKELHIRVRFWCNGRVRSHHLETLFLGHATAEEIVKHLLLALNNAGIPLSYMLMVSCDGPNVNKAVCRILNEKVKIERQNSLIDIGFCSLHLLHNAFRYGLAEFGTNASDLVIALYHYFDGWPSRREDFNKVLIEEKLKQVHFFKHATSRWLTLEPAVMRVLELWDGIVKYFLHYIPTKQAKAMNFSSYKKIASLLRIKTMKAELMFVSVSSALFSSYLGFFQNEEPLVHELHQAIKDLVLKLLLRICTKDSVSKFKAGKFETKESSYVVDKKNLLPLKDLLFGDNILNSLHNCSDHEKHNFRSSVQRHYVEAVSYILKKGLLKNEILESLSCLKPENIKASGSLSKIQRIAQRMPFPSRPDNLIDEWRLLQVEALEDKPVKEFWDGVFKLTDFNGSLKYPNITKVVQASLTLSHGNAEVERGFSKSGRIMTDTRASMSARTLSAHLTVTDTLKYYGNKPELVPITEDLLRYAHSAYKSYNSYLQCKTERKEKEKFQKEKEREEMLQQQEKQKLLERSKEKISAMEKELGDMKSEVKTTASTADALLQEANIRLKNALTENNIEEARVAQVMIAGALQSKDSTKDKEKSIGLLDKQLHKRKNSIITSFFAKKPKKE